MSKATKKGTSTKLDAFVNDIVANPEKYRKRTEAEARKEHPEMTDEQHDWAWRQAAHQLGLPMGETKRRRRKKS
jgi:hypothetical protein